MAVTAAVASTGVWRAIATAGEVTFTLSLGGHWAITGNTTAPTFPEGHGARAGDAVSLTLAGSERLWVRATSGTVYVTADAPVA